MFYRQFNLLLQDIILVGCGGTGSRAVPALVQLLKTAPNAIAPRLFLVDGDEVEYKNLTRQNFIQPDVSRNKATVLAERYGQAFDFPVISVPEFVTNDKGNLSTISKKYALEQGHNSGLRSTRRVIILCVDSIAARRTVMRHARAGDIIIDAGNEDTYGHVSIFDTVCIGGLGEPYAAEPIKPFTGEYALPFIPATTSMWEDAELNPPEATGSCADLDQSLAINFMMSAGILNVLQNLVYNNKFYYRTMYFDLHRGNSSERMTPLWLAQEFSGAISQLDKYPSMAENTYITLSKSDGVPATNSPKVLYKAIENNVGKEVTFVPEHLLNLLS